MPAQGCLGARADHLALPVVEKISSDGMGIVHKAEDLKLGRFVALKFLPDSVAKNPEALGPFAVKPRPPRP